MNEINVDEIISEYVNNFGDNILGNDILNEPSDNSSNEVHNEIPVNSGSLLIDETTSRFSSAIWFDKVKTKAITLAGVGGIGSYVGFLLGRLKPHSLTLWDPDRVELANLSGQLYGKHHIGDYKVLSLSGILMDYADFSLLFAHEECYTECSGTTDIMICGFDNMESRKIFFGNWLEHVRKQPKEDWGNCLFIDGRLAVEEFQVFCLKGDDEYNIGRYFKEYLFSDSEADEVICSYKQTSFMANMIASIIVNLFVNFVTNQCDPVIERDLPFYTVYNAETMYFKTEA